MNSKMNEAFPTLYLKAEGWFSGRLGNSAAFFLILLWCGRVYLMGSPSPTAIQDISVEIFMSSRIDSSTTTIPAAPSSLCEISSKKANFRNALLSR